jgi:3-isopropylmalate/(R)-2-methylmalate dehydratase large subunit
MGKGGMVHLMSPATAAASAIAGRIANSELYTA